ncbi:hypothetical protein MNBD_UNCLBAC01-321 [hydrothermal vent metagenome]|uniref:Zinc protease pqqL n=1 Tax=hydrothermal vent metagenome TaxID=652676 RepID=A0A3B1CYR2_9ZZZZ
MVKKLIFFVFLFICSIFLNSSHAFEGKSSKHILNNGLTVLMSEMPTSPFVSVYGYVKTGSATEGKFLGTGISHFLEHMLFKGTPTRKVGEIAAKIQAVGGHINASTGMDYTIYKITVPFEKFNIAVEIMADIMMNATMDPVEIEKERDVIFGEMRLSNDNPSRKYIRLVFQNAYLRHPYRHPVIGYKSLLAEVSRDDLLEYYQRFYTPNNIILSIAGNIKTNEILPKVKTLFKDFKRKHDILRNLPIEQRQISPRRYEEEYPTDLTRLSLAFGSVPLLHPDLYPLDVLAKILGHGKSSRLYEELYKKKGLVHSISASSYTPMDQGIFQIQSILENENVEATIKEVLEQIRNIEEKGVSDEELKKAKRQVLSEHIFSYQTSEHTAHAQAVDEAFTGDYQFSQKYVKGIRTVTSKNIERVAKNYLDESALSITILKPIVKIHEQNTSNEKQQGTIQKHVLKNGLTVLLREDPTFPLVSMRLMCRGGYREETDANNGISTMSASLWTKGTKELTAKQIAQKTERLGMQLSSYAGKNSFGISIDFLSEDLSEALNLLDDVVKNPTFPENELKKVKINMQTALRKRKDSIFYFSSDILKKTLFTTHPFRLNKNGTEESIKRITQKNIRDFHTRFTYPNNMVITVFGDISAPDVLKEIEKKFGALTAQEVELSTYTPVPLTERREKEVVINKEQAMISLGFHGTDLHDPDRYGMKVLTSILGSSFSGRLFQSIREELGQAYTLGGSFIPGIDSGFIYFYVLTTQEKAVEAKELVMAEIKRLQTEDVPADELKNIKTYLMGNVKTSYETNSSLSFTTGLDELYGLGFANYKKYDTNISAITATQIKKLAQKYLDLNKVAIIMTLPIKE